MLAVELQKNGDVIKQIDLPHHRCHMALVMDQALLDSQEGLEEEQRTEVDAGRSSQTPTAAEVIAACPMYPAVTAEHFPLGAALLYRAEISSQWTLGQVTILLQSISYDFKTYHLSEPSNCCLN